MFYNTTAIRELLKIVFDDQGLVIFCYDHFPTVYNCFAAEMGLLWKIQLLVDYCRRQLEFDKLLNLIREINPSQYENFLPLIKESDKRFSQAAIDSERSLLELVLAGNLERFSPEQLSIAITAAAGALAAVLNISPDQINILQDRVGSLILLLELPKEAANQLVTLYEAKDPQIQDLGILQIKVHAFSPGTAAHMFDQKDGEIILRLVNILAPDPLFESIQHLYDDAYNKRLTDHERAIELCQNALAVLDEPPRITLGNLDARTYAKGRCHLLIASIFLNQERLEELEKAQEHYLQSKDEFHSKQWSHLESLAYLGLAITRRKLGKFKEASDACESAQYCIDHESVPSKINKKALLEAIKEERVAIHQYSLRTTSSSGPQERKLTVYNISIGGALITAGGTTDLNFLSRRDYAQASSVSPEEVIIDLTKNESTQRPNYILKIDENVDKVSDADRGDWLFIKSENNPINLNGKTVAVLIWEGNEIHVSLKTFVNAEDHYFLRAKSKGEPSFVVTHYKSDLVRINDYYPIDGEKIIQKRVYDVRVSGVVVDHVPEKSIKNVVKAFIWQIPIVSDIAAGLDQPIAEENIIDYVELRRDERRDTTYFGVAVIGDSMSGDDIYEGDIALIRQQENVANGDIAAIVVTTPEIEALKVLKRYYIDEHGGRQHWFLKSSNPSAKHLVVIPYHTDIAQLRRIYAKEIEQDKVIFYEKAELVIAGKLIQVMKKN